MFSVVVETDEYVEWTADKKVAIRAAIKKGMLDGARDSALLARERKPHNMKASDIKWTWAPLGAAVVAVGGPAAYDGGEVHSSFRHPVFASQSIPRARWNWVSQPTFPFIELAVHEVVAEADIKFEEILQPVLDA